jgi:quercetin dioxygenase-like cupin family protein
MESISLIDMAEEKLTQAREAHSGRAAHTIHGGHDHELRQTVLALAAGHELAEHDSPGEATLQVLHGHVRLSANTDAWEGKTGDHVTIPPERHALTAIQDSVILLTVIAQLPRA